MIQRFRRNNIANPGASATDVIVYDESAAGVADINTARVVVAGRFDQIVTLKAYWCATGLDADLVERSSVALAVNTVVEADVRLLPGRNKVTMTTTTACTVWQCAVETTDDVSAGGVA